MFRPPRGFGNFFQILYVRVRTRRASPEIVYIFAGFLQQLLRSICLQNFGGFIVFLFGLQLFFWYLKGSISDRNYFPKLPFFKPWTLFFGIELKKLDSFNCFPLFPVEFQWKPSCKIQNFRHTFVRENSTYITKIWRARFVTTFSLTLVQIF